MELQKYPITLDEIDKWVENHANFTGDWTDDRSAKMKEDILKWAKIVAHKFYNLGKSLTVEDIKTILDISFWNDDPEKILQEYNRLKK